MKTIIIVDDSGIFQRILEGIIKPHFNVVGKALSGAEGFELYKKLKPDLVLMDITMPNCDGKESLQRILASFPAANVVMVSGIGDEVTVNECLKLGAKAFICKSDISTKSLGDSVLLTTIRRVLEGISHKLEAS